MQVGVDRRVLKLEEELTRVRREFETALDAVPPERLHRAPAGQWTPAQIIWHVAKVERGIAQQTWTMNNSEMDKRYAPVQVQFAYEDEYQKLYS